MNISLRNKISNLDPSNIDLGGHNRGRGGDIDSLILTCKVQGKDVRYLTRVMDGKGEPSRWISLGSSVLYRCQVCDQRVNLECNGRNIRCTNPCPYPRGMQEYGIELNVPSGKFVVENDLRDHWKIVGYYNINTAEGCRKTMLKYAEAGMAHGFVGNSCPGFYRINDSAFYIGIPGGNRNPVPGSRNVVDICTDLWWYSVVDYDDYIKRVGTPPRRVVKCKPGVYRFTQKEHLIEDKYNGKPQIFTDIKWERDPDPVVDLAARYNNLNFTAGQILCDMIKTRKGLSVADAVQDAANQLMCVLGNGCNWHPNGWTGNNPDLQMDAKSVRIPVFNKKYRWYPLCEDYTLHSACKTVKMNPSFVGLAFNICHCIVKYGAKEDRTVSLAKECLGILTQKYPNQVPKYVNEVSHL